MPAGRCAGCGRNDSARKISLHMIECQQYIDLFEQQPDRALSPEAEYQRHRREDLTPEARAARRSDRLTARFADINRHHAASTSRWATPPDILE